MSIAADMLVQNENASSWVDEMSLETARHAHIGRPADYLGNDRAFNHVTSANKALAESIDLSKRLAKDTSKTADARNEAAQRVVDQREAVLAEAERVLMEEAKTHFLQGEQLVRDTFSAEPLGDFAAFSLSNHVHMLATTKEDGTSQIRELVTNDMDVAKLLFASKPYLLGIEKGVFEKLKIHAAKAHAPKADTLFDKAEALLNLAQRYPKVRADMKRNLYSGALADRARATRVDV